MIKIAALISLLFPISLFAKEYEAQVKKAQQNAILRNPGGWYRESF